MTKKIKLLSQEHPSRKDLKFPTEIPKEMYLSVSQILKLFKTETEEKLMIHRKQIQEIVEEFKGLKNHFETEINQENKVFKRGHDSEVDYAHCSASISMAEKIINRLQQLLDKEAVGGVP